MSREILLAKSEDGTMGRYVLEVFREQEHWTSTLAKLDEKGRPQEDKVAPRFYGLTAEQARRRMMDVLGNQYEEVSSIQKD